jgi:hypothetical protein
MLRRQKVVSVLFITFSCATSPVQEAVSGGAPVAVSFRLQRHGVIRSALIRRHAPLIEQLVPVTADPHMRSTARCWIQTRGIDAALKVMEPVQ